jgi:hypothetical protein
MANVPAAEFQTLWSKLNECLRLEYGNIIQQHPGAEAVMERLSGVIVHIAQLAGSTPAAVGESPKWTLIVQSMADTTRNLQQLLKGKHLYSALYGVYTEVLHDLTAVVEESAFKEETPKTTITAPPSIEEFREEERRKRKPTDDADKRPNKLAKSTADVSDPESLSKDGAPLRPADWQGDHGDDADNSTKRQQQQTSSSQAGRPPPIVLSVRQVKGLLN